MTISNLFWMILGLGIAIPSTVLLMFNLFIKGVSGDNYKLNIKSLFIVYAIALVGWAVVFGIRGGH